MSNNRLNGIKYLTNGHKPQFSEFYGIGKIEIIANSKHDFPVLDHPLSDL